jgi:hypothetical protein
MKNVIIGRVMGFVVVLLAPPTARSQGTLYVSTLNQPSAGTAAVGRVSWLATAVLSGNNAGGYVLDSIQLDMTPASGDPSGFTVQLYTAGTGDGGQVPDSYLGTLTGSSDPVTAGLYTYTASGLTLSPSGSYFIVVTSGKAVASGAFAWSYETQEETPCLVFSVSLRLCPAFRRIAHSWQSFFLSARSAPLRDSGARGNWVAASAALRSFAAKTLSELQDSSRLHCRDAVPRPPPRQSLDNRRPGRRA